MGGDGVPVDAAGGGAAAEVRKAERVRPDELCEAKGRVLAAFSCWDKQATGWISCHCLKDVFKRIDPGFPDDGLQQLIDKFGYPPRMSETNDTAYLVVDYGHLVDYLFKGCGSKPSSAGNAEKRRRSRKGAQPKASATSVADAKAQS